MALVINTNSTSLLIQYNLNRTQEGIAVSLERLSSGMRINSAADDAAGLAISQRFLAQVNGLNQAVRNANDAVSMAQTAEGSLDEIANNLQTMRSLAVEAANSTLSTTDRLSLNTEYSTLATEILRTASAANFNGVTLLTGAQTLTFQVGPNAPSVNQVPFSTTNVASASGINNLQNVYLGSATGTAALSAISVLDVAINSISTIRANFGTLQNRFESIIRSLQTTSLNTSSALSNIRDTDYAAETANLTRLQIIQQAGIAALVQANASPRYVLSLLSGSGTTSSTGG